MASLYADEQFPLPVVERLRTIGIGHDVLTVQESGKAGLSDPEVLAFAVSLDRAVLTVNRRDFGRLHSSEPNHSGIVACSEDLDFERLANRIDEAIAQEVSLHGKLIRVNKPSR